MELRKSNFKKATTDSQIDNSRNSKRVQIVQEPVNKDVLAAVKNKNQKSEAINYDDLYEDRDIKDIEKEIIREEEPENEDPLMKVKRLSMRGKELGKIRQSLKKQKNENDDEYKTEETNTKVNTKLNEDILKKDDEELNKIKNNFYNRKRYFKINDNDVDEENKNPGGNLNRSTENRRYINVNKNYNLSKNENEKGKEKEKEKEKEIRSYKDKDNEENKNTSKKIKLNYYSNNPSKKVYSNYSLNRDQKHKILNKELNDEPEDEKRPSGVFKYFFHTTNNKNNDQKLSNKNNNNRTMGVIDYEVEDEEKITNAKITITKEKVVEPFFEHNRSFEYRHKYHDDIAKKNLDKVYEDIKRAEERKKLRNLYIKDENDSNDEKEKSGPKKELESFYERYRRRRDFDKSRNNKENNNNNNLKDKYNNTYTQYKEYKKIEKGNDYTINYNNKDNNNKDERNNSTRYRYFQKYNRPSNDIINENKEKEKETEIKKPEEDVRSHSWARRRYYKKNIDDDNEKKEKIGNKNMKVFKEYLTAREFREELDKNKDNKNYTLVEEEPHLKKFFEKGNTDYRWRNENISLKDPNNVDNEEEIIEEEIITTKKQKPIVKRYYMKITGKNREEIEQEKQRQRRRENDRQKALERQKEIERKKEIERQQKERERQKLERERQRLERERQERELERKRELERQRKQRELEREKKLREIEKQREREREKERLNNSVGVRRHYYIKTETNNLNEDDDINTYRKRPKFKAVLDRIEVTKDVKYYKDKPYSRVNTDANEDKEELVKREIYRFNKNIEGNDNNKKVYGKPFVIEIRKEEEKIVNKEEEEVVETNNNYRKKKYYNK